MIVKNNGCATKPKRLPELRLRGARCSLQSSLSCNREICKKKNAKAFIALWMLSVGLCVIIVQNMYINKQPQTYQKDFEGRL